MEPTLLSFYRPTPDLATEVLPLPYHPACISQGHPVYGAVTSDLQISRVCNSVGWFLTLVVRAFWADFTLTHIIFFFFTCLFLAAPGLCLCVRALSSCGERGLLSSCGSWAFHCSGLSCCGAWALDLQAAVVAALRL